MEERHQDGQPPQETTDAATQGTQPPSAGHMINAAEAIVQANNNYPSVNSGGGASVEQGEEGGDSRSLRIGGGQGINMLSLASGDMLAHTDFNQPSAPSAAPAPVAQATTLATATASATALQSRKRPPNKRKSPNEEDPAERERRYDRNRRERERVDGVNRQYEALQSALYAAGYLVGSNRSDVLETAAKHLEVLTQRLQRAEQNVQDMAQRNTELGYVLSSHRTMRSNLLPGLQTQNDRAIEALLAEGSPAASAGAPPPPPAATTATTTASSFPPAPPAPSTIATIQGQVFAGEEQKTSGMCAVCFLLYR